MKKIFGVMILAGFPVACGTSLPSTPDAMQNGTAADESSVSSLRTGKRVPAPTGCLASDPETPIDAIRLAVVFEGDGYVRVRAEAQVSGSEPANLCFVPTWGTSPLSRDASLTVEKDPREATLVALPGRYTIVAAVDSGQDRRIAGSLTVTIK